MGKKILCGIIVLILLSGCKTVPPEKETPPLEKIMAQFAEMENYGCTATLKRMYNSKENIYETKQYYKSSGEYRVELLAPDKVKGTITLFDGVMVSQYNPRIEGKIMIDAPPSRDRDEMFLGYFVKNYMQTEDASVETSTVNDATCTVLEAVIPGNHPYLATEKLWVNNETLKPVQLIIYDPAGKEKIVVLYNEFAYNMDLNDALFKVNITE